MNLELARSYIEMCNLLSKQSKCVKASVGALIVRDGRIISSGVNGTPAGYVNCCDIFDYKAKDPQDKHKKFNKHKIWSMKNEIHAEVNALTKAGAVYELQNKFYLIVNKMPCEQCQKMIALYCPIAVYYYDEKDDIENDKDNILNSGGIKYFNLYRYSKS